MDSHTPRAAADVKDATTDKAHRPPLLRPPPPKRRQVIRRIPRKDTAVIPLDHLDHTLTGGEIHQQMPKRVLIVIENRPQHYRKLRDP